MEYRAIITYDQRMYHGECVEVPDVDGAGQTFDACCENLLKHVRRALEQQGELQRANPLTLRTEREDCIDEIYAAFAHVTREGGISWSETDVIDDYGTAEQRAAPRANDMEAGWQQLVDDPHWICDRGFGGFSFLDPIGFRYYLPPAMIRSLRCDAGAGDIAFHLKAPDSNTERSKEREQWSALSAPQRHCVAHFIRTMMLIDAANVPDSEYWYWALRDYWHQF
jgi:predicted RNase H-like HicB family nuclease